MRMPPRNLFEKMNKTERHRAIQLEAMKRDGQIRDWRFEEITLKLADDCRYTPDFAVIENDGTLRFEETKGGFIREDAWIKIKVAARRFSCRFTVYQLKKGEWTIREIAA